MAVNGTIDKGFSPPKQYLGFTSAPILAATAGGTIRVGDVLIDSSGTAIKATADATTLILGVAASAATSGQTVRYYPALPGVIFEATLEDETNENHALAATDLFGRYAVQVDPGGSLYHYIDENDSTNYSVTVVGFVDAATTVQARVLVMFNKSVFMQ